MNGDALSSFFLQSSRSAQMRRLYALAVYEELIETWPRAAVDVEMLRGVLRVVIALPRWQLWFLGTAHALAWWRARRVARKLAEKVSVQEVTWKIRVRTL